MHNKEGGFPFLHHHGFYMKDILTTIIEKRKNDILTLGLNFGTNLPKERTRDIHPFLKSKGVILEVKRASPSKGDIAPELNSYETAESYIKAGARAISCLTEKNYFKGSLTDLMSVCQAVDKTTLDKNMKPAVLRKDFLLFPEEIEISYLAGADAVLLIARILSKDELLKMAQEVVCFGLNALIEIRSDEDLEKIRFIASQVPSENFVFGVNSRDLTTFKIDLLRPCIMFSKIQKIIGANARIIFESGVTNYECAAAVSSMGFTGLLLGEAAAKNPELRQGLVQSFMNSKPTMNSEFWKSYCQEYNFLKSNSESEAASLFKESAKPGSDNPIIKLCGFTRSQDAVLADELGVSFLGFIFADAFPRSVTHEDRLERLLPHLSNLHCKKIAVIVNLDSPESKKAIQLVKDGTLDALQFHKIPYEAVSNDLLSLPHYFAVGNFEEYEKLISKGEMRVLLDSKDFINCKAALPEKSTYEIKWIAGNITPDNIYNVILNYHPELIDVSSGIEDEIPGIKNAQKMKQLLSFPYLPRESFKNSD